MALYHMLGARRDLPLASLCLYGCFSRPLAVVSGRVSPAVSSTMADRNLSGVSLNRVQFYLDEVVPRHNRRRQPYRPFRTLLGLGAGHDPTSYKRIQGVQDLTNPSPKADPKIWWYAETTV
jgi:hypothetical protein